MSKRAIILAGGKGTRLKPYTVSLPKPLVPIGNMPILEIVIRQLVKYGFDHITLTVNHMADIIKAFCGDGSKWGILIDYSFENIPLSTMGPLKLLQNLPDNFLVMNGDVLTDLPFDQFYDFHIKSNSIFTISSYQRKHLVDYGVLQINKNQQLVSFTEKPSLSYDVSMGVYMVNRKILDYIPKNTFFGFDHLMLKLIESGVYPMTKLHQGYWLDIGRPEDYELACSDFELGKIVI